MSFLGREQEQRKEEDALEEDTVESFLSMRSASVFFSAGAAGRIIRTWRVLRECI